MTNPTASPAILIGPSCKVCQRGIPPAQAANLGDDLQGYTCEKCWVNIQVANSVMIEALNNGNNAVDRGQCCAECEMTLNQIKALTGRRSLFPTYKDGVMLLLCRFCVDKHDAKVKETTSAWGREKAYSDRDSFALKCRQFWAYMRRKGRQL